MQTGKIDALYARFSHDENYGSDSDSVAHQKELLADYANSHGFTNQKFYVDDGYTGVNFDRPEFKRMLMDIENGLVRTVIVKDLSRLGRNYLMVGQYTEMVFPSHDVRFIAISDNIDSDEGMNELMPFSNLINEWYSRDISKKMRAMIQQKGQSGKRLCTKPIYGYKRDPDDETKWIIDEYAAGIVRRVYAMYLSGMGITEIANTLKDEKVLRPSFYFHEDTRYGNHVERKYNWSGATVSCFLTKLEYCGDTVNFKFHRISYKNKKMVKTPEEQRMIFRDTHPAIIDRGTFERVQELYARRTKKKRKPAGKTEQTVYSDFLYCLDCKQKMHIRRGGGGRKPESHGYECSGYRKRVVNCFYHYISFRELDKEIARQFEILFALAKKHPEKLKKMISKRIAESCEKNAMQIKAESENANARIQEIDRYVQGLFESKIKGEIDGELFGNLSKSYMEEKAELKQRIVELIQEEIECKARTNDLNRFYAAFEKYDSFEKVTRELLVDFVDRIEVGAMVRNEETGEKSRIIKILFRGVGILPLE